MRKLFLAGAFALLGAVSVSAQASGYPKLGFHVGLLTGDAADVYSFNAGADVAYLWNMGSGFDLGLTSGYSHYFVKSDYSDYVDGSGVIPIAATAKYTVAPNFFLGADLGYALDTAKDSDGGFYYQPKVGYESGNTEFYLAYKGISNNGSIGSVNVGVAFKLGQ